MRDREFQEELLGIERPWFVDEVAVDRQRKIVETFVAYEGQASCSICGRACGKHDHRERRWRHLDIYEFEAFVIAQVPRVDCPEHGVHQIAVPWADGRGGFTALFARLAISLLQEMSIAAVARTLRLSWDEIDGIMQRAITRGLALRQGRVDAFWKSLSAEQLAGIEGIAMDMWPAYIESALAFVPGAAAMKRTRFDWLRSPKSMDHADKIAFAKLRGEHERLGRAWAIKEAFGHFWSYRYIGAARNFFHWWYGWAVRSRLRHMKDVAKIIARHFENILTYLRIPITNAGAHGFRNETRFMRVVLFHRGGLDLNPAHTNS